MTAGSSMFSILADGGKMIMFVDMEPDDRFAYLFAVHLIKNHPLVMADKKHFGDVAQEILKNVIIVPCLRNPNAGVLTVTKDLGDGSPVRVLPGFDGLGIKKDWYDPEAKYETIQAPAYDPKAHEETRHVLIEEINSAKNSSVIIFFLTVATDFVSIMDKINPNKINMMFGQGGHLPNKACGFNWISDLDATKKLIEYIQVNKIPFFVVTNEAYSKAFPNGSLSIKQYPQLIEELKKSRSPTIRNIMEHAAAWGRYVAETIPAVRDRVGADVLPNQFCPADPVVVTIAFSEKIDAEPVVYDTIDKVLPIPKHDPSSFLHLVTNITPEETLRVLNSLIL